MNILYVRIYLQIFGIHWAYRSTPAPSDDCLKLGRAVRTGSLTCIRIVHSPTNAILIKLGKV